MTNADANQQLQGAGDKGINIFALSLGIGTPLLLVTGAMLWLLWRRQVISRNAQASPWSNNNAQASPWSNNNAQASPWSNNNAQASPWSNNYEMPSTPDVSQYASFPSLAAGMPEALPMPGSTAPMPSPQVAYTPSDLRPMTSAFPQQMLTTSSSNGASSAQNGDLVPLPMDTLNLPLQSSRARAAIRNGQKPTTPAPSAALMDSLIPSMSSPLPVIPVPPLAIQPPSIKEDPLLEEVMRQAQMGLFALSRR
jgi:hypothetical protein